MSYVIGKLLGKGTYGHVHLARTRSGADIAVKVFDVYLGEDLNPGVIRELCAIQMLYHENIVHLLGIKMNPESIEMAMEYGGVTLDAYISATPESVRYMNASDVLGKVLSAISYMHRIGVIHRDIKPANILVDGNDGTHALNVRLCDFGLAKKVAPFRIKSHTPNVCTCDYKSPELLSDDLRDYGTKIDIWAMGCVMYEYMTNTMLFIGNTELMIIKSILRKLRPSIEDRRRMGFHSITSNGNTDESNVFNKITHDAVRISIKRMVSFIPEDRPTAADVLVTLGQRENNKINDQRVNEHNRRRFGSDFFIRAPDGPRVALGARRQSIDVMEKRATEKQCLCIAINIFDMYADVANPVVITRKWQYIAGACVLIASKYVELHHLHAYNITPDGASETSIMDWEREILNALGFRIGGPTLLDIYRITVNDAKIPDADWHALLTWLREYTPIAGKTAREIRGMIVQEFVNM